MDEDIRDADNRPPIIGVDEYGSMFIMHNGSAASYFKGQWQPGIIFEGKDLMDFMPITDPEEVQMLMAQAESALRQWLQQFET